MSKYFWNYNWCRIAVYYKPRLHSDPTCEEQTKLQVIQNKMLRLLAGKRPADKVRIEDLSRKFNMMSMNQMASYHVLMETYNAINLGSSGKIRDKLLPSTTTGRYLTVPLFKKSSCRSFSYFASRLWNQLPLEISTKAKTMEPMNDKSCEARIRTTFKREIKRWILNGGVPFR